MKLIELHLSLIVLHVTLKNSAAACVDIKKSVPTITGFDCLLINLITLCFNLTFFVLSFPFLAKDSFFLCSSVKILPVLPCGFFNPSLGPFSADNNLIVLLEDNVDKSTIE